MNLRTDLLQELSDLLVEDLRASQYYQQLSADERAALDGRLSAEATRGFRPLLPGALENDLDTTNSMAEDQLGIQIPTELFDVLKEVDGFSEQGVCLYFADQDFESFGTSIVAENISLRSALPELADKYLFIGDSELWYFVWNIESNQYAALSRPTLEPVHYFDSVEDLVNDMLSTALLKPTRLEKGSLVN